MHQMIFAITIIPVIGLCITSLLFYFILKFYRTEATMSFPNKIRLLRNLVNLTLILFIIGGCLAAFMLLLAGGTISYTGLLGFEGAGIFNVLFSLVLLGIQCYFYYLIYKEYKILIDNFEQERIFEDENVNAFQKIAKISIWIVLFQLTMNFMNYGITFIYLYWVQHKHLFHHPLTLTNNVNISANLDTSILVYFIICLVLNILSVVFEKAVAIHKENQFTI